MKRGARNHILKTGRKPKSQKSRDVKKKFYSMEDLFNGVGGVIFIIVYVAIVVLLIASYWKVFEKAGKPGWAAIVPIYNVIVILEIIGKPLWWVILLFIPFVNIIFGIMMVNLLSKSFGKDVGFTIGLLFLPFIFLPILGFDKSIKYIGPSGEISPVVY